LKLFFPNTI